MTNESRCVVTFFLFACVLAPHAALASVRINEVMYDLDGTDADREWIEVVNDGSTAVDIASFKLFEGNTNHALTVSSGSTVLAPGGVAVIAAVPSKFLVDWPGFTGTLLDSAFSLSNSGEALAIKNGSDGLEDEVTYASTMGAQGDGKSLGRSGAAFSSQTPTPGSSGSLSPSAPEEDDAPTQTSATASAPGASAALVRTITIHAGEDRTVIVGAGSVFTAEVYGTEGKLAPDARVVWNFGNGESREGRSVTFFYRYPGRYAVTALAALGEYTASTLFVAQAVPAEVGLRAETDGSLSVLNTGARDLDVSLWQVERAGILFRFPKGTAILAGEGVRLPPETTGIPRTGDARLLYPNGGEATASVAALERLTDTTPIVLPPAARTTAVRAGATPSPVEAAVPEASAPSPYVAAVAAANSTQGGTSDEGDDIFLWLIGALGISVLGAAGVLMARLSPAPEESMTQAVTLADKEAEEYRLL